MGYKIIVDSGCDLTIEMEKEMNIGTVPFKIAVEDKEFIDDKNFNMEDFLKTMKASSNPIKTSCPSPFDYEEAVEEANSDEVFIITISSKLSGSYNSANIAKNVMMDKYPNKKVHVFDSKSASAGEVCIALKINEYIKAGMGFEEIVEKTENDISSLKTFFILESLDNLIKNGRIKKTAGLIANVLNIRPIMSADDGEIILFEMNRGFKKSLSKLADALGKVVDNIEERTLVISHVDDLERAEEFKKKVLSLYNFKDIKVVHTKGLASGYADDGGIVIAF